MLHFILRILIIYGITIPFSVCAMVDNRWGLGMYILCAALWWLMLEIRSIVRNDPNYIEYMTGISPEEQSKMKKIS